MTDELKAQVSAFLDEELHDTESELLVRRLCADDELRTTLGRFMLIGDAIRNESITVPAAFASRVAAAVGGDVVEPALPVADEPQRRMSWAPGRSAAATAIAAAVAISAVLALRTTTVEAPQLALAGPEPSEIVPAVAEMVTPMTNMTVPASMPMARRSAGERARLNKYLITHNEYSASTGRQGMLPYRAVGSQAAQVGLERIKTVPEPERR